MSNFNCFGSWVRVKVNVRVRVAYPQRVRVRVAYPQRVMVRSVVFTVWS